MNVDLISYLVMKSQMGTTGYDMSGRGLVFFSSTVFVRHIMYVIILMDPSPDSTQLCMITSRRFNAIIKLSHAEPAPMIPRSCIPSPETELLSLSYLSFFFPSLHPEPFGDGVIRHVLIYGWIVS